MQSHPPVPEPSEPESKVPKSDDEDEDESIRKQRAVVFVDDEPRDVGTAGSGGSGAGSGGSETVIGSSNGVGNEPLDQELSSPEVQDWATRVR